MQNRTITSLAILTVNWGRFKKDYTENFIPFLLEAINIWGVAQIKLDERDGDDISTLQSIIEENFGLKIPLGSISVLLTRLNKRGYLRKEKKLYRVVNAKIDALNFATTRAEVLRKHEALIEKLRGYCKDKYSVSWSIEEANVALQEYFDMHDIDVLMSSVAGKILVPTGKSIKNSMYLVSSFASNLYQNDPEGFEYLDTVVKGNILANALVYTNVSKLSKKYFQTEFYFDTGFLFRALGLEGEIRKAPALELLNYLYLENATLKVFPHTIDEMKSVLEYCASRIRKNKSDLNTSPVLDYMLCNNYQLSNVETISATLENLLATRKITKGDTPKRIYKFQIDETALSNQLNKDIHYSRESAKDKDVESLSAIFRARRGRDFTAIEYSPIIFITTNVTLATSAFRFFNNKPYSFRTPLCITANFLTNLLWLKNPNQLADLPKKQMIAISYAALEPGEDLWKKYLEEIERLKTMDNVGEEDYILLRYSIEAKNFLMNLTKGDKDELKTQTIPEILSKIKNAIQQKEIARYDEEVRKHAQTKKLLKNSEEKLYSRNQKLSRYSKRIGFIVSKVILGIFILLIIIEICMTLPVNGLLHGYGFWYYIVLALNIAVLIFSALSLYNGTTVKSFVRRIELFISNKIFELLLNVFGDE